MAKRRGQLNLTTQQRVWQILRIVIAVILVCSFSVALLLQPLFVRAEIASEATTSEMTSSDTLSTGNTFPTSATTGSTSTESPQPTETTPISETSVTTPETENTQLPESETGSEATETSVPTTITTTSTNQTVPSESSTEVATEISPETEIIHLLAQQRDGNEETIFIHYVKSSHDVIAQSFEITDTDSPLPAYLSSDTPLVAPDLYWTGQWYYEIKNVDGTVRYEVLNKDDTLTNLQASLSEGETLYTGKYPDFCLYPLTAYKVTYDSQNGSPIDPMIVPHYFKKAAVLSKNDVDAHVKTPPERLGFIFAGWYLDEECSQPAFVEDPVGTFKDLAMQADTTLYAKWRPTKNANEKPEYVPFQIAVRTENVEDNGFTTIGDTLSNLSQGILYAIPGSTIRVKSTYYVDKGKLKAGYPDGYTFNHPIVCVLTVDGIEKEYPVYRADDMTGANTGVQAYISDDYKYADDPEAYFLFNNFEDEIMAQNGATLQEKYLAYRNSLRNSGVNTSLSLEPWADTFLKKEGGVYTDVMRRPYDTTTEIREDGSTTITFDYMRYRTDLVFQLNNGLKGNVPGTYHCYMNIAELIDSGIFNGVISDTGSSGVPAGNHSYEGTGVNAAGSVLKWSYQASLSQTAGSYNTYTIHAVKYRQNIRSLFPDGNLFLTGTTGQSFFVWGHADARYTLDNKSLNPFAFAMPQAYLNSQFLRQENTIGNLPRVNYRQRDAAAVPLAAYAAGSSKQNNGVLIAKEILPDETDFDFLFNGRRYKVDPTLTETIFDNYALNSNAITVALDSRRYAYLGYTLEQIGKAGGRSFNFVDNTQLFSTLPNLGRNAFYLGNTDADRDYNKNYLYLEVPGRPEKDPKGVTFFNLLNKYYKSLKDTSDSWDTFGHFPRIAGKWDAGSEMAVYPYMRNRYTLTFDLGYGTNPIVAYGGVNQLGGVDLMFEQSVSDFRQGKPYNESLEALSRTGYQFIGWQDERGHVLTDSDWDALIMTRDMRLTAKWQPLHTVKFFADDTSAEPFLEKKIPEGATVEMPTASELIGTDIDPATQRWLWRPSWLAETSPMIEFDFTKPISMADGQPIAGTDPVEYEFKLYAAPSLKRKISIVYDMDDTLGGLSSALPEDGKRYEDGSAITLMRPDSPANRDSSRTFLGWQVIEPTSTGAGTSVTLFGVNTKRLWQPGERMPVNAELMTMADVNDRVTLKAAWGRDILIRVKAEGDAADRVHPLYSFTTSAETVPVEPLSIHALIKKTPEEAEISLESLKFPHEETQFAHDGTLILKDFPFGTTLLWSATPPKGYTFKAFLVQDGRRLELSGNTLLPSQLPDADSIELEFYRDMPTPTGYFVDTGNALPLAGTAIFLLIGMGALRLIVKRKRRRSS